MGYKLHGRGSILDMGKRLFSSPQCPYQLWGSPSLLSTGQGVNRRGRDASHLSPSNAKAKNGRAVPPLPHTFMVWCLILPYLYLLLLLYTLRNKHWNTITLSLCLIKHQAMKTYWEWRFTQAFLTSVLDGGESSASRSGRLTSRERTLVSVGYCLYPRSWSGRWESKPNSAAGESVMLCCLRYPGS
jgi:hypothetical protein